MPWTRKSAPAELRRLLLEDADELGADRLALGLGVGDAGELLEEALLGVDGDERDLELVAERGDDLLALVLAHEAVVDEHARQLVADRAVDEQRRDARVDAARQAADDLAVADLRRGCARSAPRRSIAADQVRSAAADVARGSA